MLGFSSFDEIWYNKVLDAVAFRNDIAKFPKEDQTLIGSKGITLSGGQMQRLAIARAVYARNRLAIFDDVLSGLDPTTEKHVFEEVFGPRGLLRRQGTTIILSTHAVSHLTSADYIVAIGSKGTVIEKGTFDELNTSSGYVHGLSVQNFDKMQEEGETKENIEAQSTVALKPNALAAELVEDTNRQSGELSVYGYYLKAVGIGNTALWLTYGTVFAFFYIIPTVWLKWWADANSLHPDRTNGLYLVVYATFQITWLVSVLLFHVQGQTTMANKSGIQFHWTVLKTVLSAPMAFFNKTDVGITINRFSQDMQLIDAELPLNSCNLVVSLFVSVGQLIVTATVSPYIVIAFLPLIWVMYLTKNIYLRTSRQLRLMSLEAKSPLYSHFLETLSGLATIRAFGWSEANRELSDQLLDASQQPAYLLTMIQRWLNLVLDFVVAVLGVIVVFLAVKLQADSGFTGVALINLMSLNGMLKNTIMTWTTVETSIGAVSRVKNFSETTRSENLPREVIIPPREWPQKGIIEIQGVSASYDADDGDPVLTNLSLSIKAGEKVGICGRSGSGKSSLVLSLFRMIELQEGSIIIDGIDISALPRDVVRSRLNAIPQEPFFLSGSIRLNLDPYEKSSDGVLIEALKKVQLWQTIDSQGGLSADFNIDMLSHGQRQLFCLARAILRSGNIVVLDEATSSVDRQTDELMQRVIREEFADRTIIVVAHRLDTILDFDRVAVLDDGMLVEYDSPTTLLRTDSAFRRLYGKSKMA